MMFIGNKCISFVFMVMFGLISSLPALCDPISVNYLGLPDFTKQEFLILFGKDEEAKKAVVTKINKFPVYIPSKNKAYCSATVNFDLVAQLYNQISDVEIKGNTDQYWIAAQFLHGDEVLGYLYDGGFVGIADGRVWKIKKGYYERYVSLTERIAELCFK
ncbi:MAG: hypothetical protein JKY93_03750 [Gammaproteobacteria bacterium]|nr:hypothetical protein [Gammaproteobacteria bacterium]